jgi:pimeloyl-ACP methyl ester carboxylesterase
MTRLAWALLLATPLAAASAQPERPMVVFVHGRGQAGNTADEVRAYFTRAFADGQRRAFAVPVVTDGDIAFVWYADAIDESMKPPPIAQNCAAASAPTPEETARWNDWRTSLIGVLGGLGLEKAILDAFMNDTYRYLSGAEARCQVDSRLELALTRNLRRPLIVVAHSMGGIVSFASIRQNATTPLEDDRLRIDRLVTMGTQVGLEVILQGLLGSLIELPVDEPNTIRSWINFINQDDKLAFPTKDSFRATDAARKPRDVRIDARGISRHAAATYLSDASVVRAIVFAWCRSHVAPGKPVSCAAVEAAGDVR